MDKNTSEKLVRRILHRGLVKFFGGIDLAVVGKEWLRGAKAALSAAVVSVATSANKRRQDPKAGEKKD